MFILYWIFSIFRLRLMRLTVFIAFFGFTIAHLSTNVMQKLPFLRTEEQKGKYLFKSFESKLFVWTSITVNFWYELPKIFISSEENGILDMANFLKMRNSNKKLTHSLLQHARTGAGNLSKCATPAQCLQQALQQWQSFNNRKIISKINKA